MKAAETKMTPQQRTERQRVLQRKYTSIREFAEALIRLVNYKDVDGREIGFDYGYVRERILAKYPTVVRNGPHKGRPTKMPFKELQNYVCELNKQGVRLPFRPRRKSEKGIGSLKRIQKRSK